MSETSLYLCVSDICGIKIKSCTYSVIKYSIIVVQKNKYLHCYTHRVFSDHIQFLQNINGKTGIVFIIIFFS